MTAALLERFRAEVGADGAVVAAGGRTQWHLGGPPDPGAREVSAPAGISEHDPAEMVVRVRAGSTLAELREALAAHGQETALDAAEPTRATVGGILSAGQSGVRRLRLGPVRDALLEVTFVTADGKLAKGGGPVVKNVTGFDVCRLMVGSLGTLGLIAEVVLRCVPIPSVSRWVRADADPFAARAALHRPSAVLWDGATTWVLLEGHPSDVDAEAGRLGPGWVDAEGPPALPPHRHSLDPAGIARAPGGGGPFVAEVGVGTVHRHEPPAARQVAPAVRHLNERIKSLFDPTGRLAPGRIAL